MEMERKGSSYIISGRMVSADSLLDEVMRLDDGMEGTMTMSQEECQTLDELFSSYSHTPFSGMSFMKASGELFSYIAQSGDEELARAVARNMGWLSEKERKDRLSAFADSSASYREYWMILAREVLTVQGFEDFRFGSIKHDGCGTYLYDNEKAVCYIEVSRSGDDERSAVISLTLLGNPEAVDDEDGECQFEWCCYFDDELSDRGDDALILGGRLRTIDPFGRNSLLHRRYDLVYDSIDAITLATVVRSLTRMLESLPPRR